MMVTTMVQLTEIVNNVVVTLAAIVGGFWVLNRLKRERTDEAALEMSLTVNSSRLDAPAPNKYLVVFTVELANKGKTKIEAKTKRTANVNIFEDGPEILKHSCSLQIRRIDEAQVSMDRSLDWFEGAAWQLLPVFHGETQIDVLVDYRNANERDSFGNEIVEFWMEPGETYRPGVPVVLPKGTYVAKSHLLRRIRNGTGWTGSSIKSMGLSPSLATRTRISGAKFMVLLCRGLRREGPKGTLAKAYHGLDPEGSGPCSGARPPMATELAALGLVGSVQGGVQSLEFRVLGPGQWLVIGGLPLPVRLLCRGLWARATKCVLASMGIGPVFCVLSG